MFTFDDGALTIVVPPGALAADVDMLATALGPEDRPEELSDVQMSGTFYRLEPDGLTFPVPVTIIRRVALSDLGLAAGDPLPVVTLALRTTDGAWSWLDSQSEISDGEYLYLSGEASHTSRVLGFGGSNDIDVSWDGVSPGPDGALRLAEGGRFILNSQTTTPVDAPRPPTLNKLNPYAVSAELVERYEQLFPQSFEPFTNTGVLAGDAQIDNPVGWSAMTSEQRAASYPSYSQPFQCNTTGHFYTVVGYEVVDVGAGSALWDRLGLEPPSTRALFPVGGDCLAQAPGVEVGAACMITIHTARGTYVSYLRGLIELIEGAGGPTVTGIEVTLGGANDGEPAIAKQKPGGVWEFIEGLHSAGNKKIEKVLVHLASGETQDITDVVKVLFGGDTISVPYPAQPTFGTCPKGAG